VAWVESGWVSHLWFGFEFQKISLKMPNFSIFFPSDQKNLLGVGSESTRVNAGSASYLLRVKSKLGLGQGPSLTINLALVNNFYLVMLFVRNLCSLLLQ